MSRVERCIARHQAAYAAFIGTVNHADEVWVAQHGAPATDAAMREARGAWFRAHNVENAAWRWLLQCRPYEPADLARMLRYVAESPRLEVLDDASTLLDHLAAAAEAVARRTAQ